LKGKFVFSTQEVLKVACKAEEATAEKTSRKRRRIQPVATEIEEVIEEALKDESVNSDSDCTVVLQRQ
jgi:hypothetical protein